IAATQIQSTPPPAFGRLLLMRGGDVFLRPAKEGCPLGRRDGVPFERKQSTPPPAFAPRERREKALAGIIRLCGPPPVPMSLTLKLPGRRALSEFRLSKLRHQVKQHL